MNWPKKLAVYLGGPWRIGPGRMALFIGPAE